MIERFEEAEQRKPGEVSIADLPGVLKLKNEFCEAQVLILNSKLRPGHQVLSLFVSSASSYVCYCYNHAVIEGISYS